VQNNGIVSGAPTRQKIALVETNNIVKNRSKAMSKDFGDNFVDDIAKANGTKVFVCDGWVNLRDED